MPSSFGIPRDRPVNARPDRTRYQAPGVPIIVMLLPLRLIAASSRSANRPLPLILRPQTGVQGVVVGIPLRPARCLSQLPNASRRSKARSSFSWSMFRRRVSRAHRSEILYRAFGRGGTQGIWTSTPSAGMLPSVIGGPEKRLDWIGFTFCCASKMADPQSSTCMSLCGFPCTQVEFD